MDGKRFIANVKGVGIKGVAREFYMSEKSTELTGGSWSTEIPNLGDNKYLWYRDKFTLTNGTVATTTPVCDGVWEAIYNIYDINENIEEYVTKVEEVSNTLDTITSNVDELSREIQPIERGGTGAVTAADALNNLGAAAMDHTHKFGEVLVSGADWQMGKTRTIANISKYSLYLVKFNGLSPVLIGMRYGSRIDAITGFCTASPDDFQRIYTARFSISGTTVKYEDSSMMSHRPSGSHGSWSGAGVEYLKGLI